MMAGFNDLPKVEYVGAQWAGKSGRRCGRCNNGTGVYNPECPCNKNRDRAPQVVPYLPEKAELHTFFGFDE